MKRREAKKGGEGEEPTAQHAAIPPQAKPSAVDRYVGWGAAMNLGWTGQRAQNTSVCVTCERVELARASSMQAFVSASAVVFVGVLAVLLPLVVRILSSPSLLLIFAPLLLSCLLIAFLLFFVYLGHVLDATRRFSRPNLTNAARPLAFSTPAAWQALITRSQWSLNDSPLSPLVPQAPQLSRALNDVIALIVRDFVQSWYRDISSSPCVPQAVTALIHQSLQKLRDRAEGVDVPAFLVRRIIPKVTAHIEQFRQSEMALRGADLERRLTQSDELDILLANKYTAKGSGKLHPAIENLSSTFTRQTEEMHLRKLVDQILPFVLPENEAKSRALTIVVREIIVCTVLYPVVDMVSDPDFWNQSIDRVVRSPYILSLNVAKNRCVPQAGDAIRQQYVIITMRRIYSNRRSGNLSAKFVMFLNHNRLKSTKKPKVQQIQ